VDRRVTRPQLAVYVAAAVALALIGARYLHDSARGSQVASAPAPAVRLDRASGGRVVVDVAGAVRRPGVYRLEAGARVDDAVRRAGGAAPRADLASINLAAKLEDGKQVLVPVRAPPGDAASGAPGSTAAAPGRPVNLNTATLEQLDTLAGVGPATAQKILDYREQHGGFSSVEELDRVPGIGPGRLAALRDLVRV
jgi:competence protein ComEA